MRVSVFGLGYVGSVSAACLAADGHDVVGVDINETKVSAFNDGHSPIVESGLDTLIAAGRAAGRLRSTTRAEKAVIDTDLSFVCIQTPSAPNGSLDLRYVLRVAEEIGAALACKQDRHTVVFRSTMLPGTMEQLVLPALERASGKKPGTHFGVAYHPEFLREGSAIADYRNPPRTVIGADDEASACLVASLYPDVTAPLVVCSLRTAELVKYSDNAFHALKVAFANEIGSICRAVNVDSHELMAIFCKDTKLNLSPTYLRPGYAFGGSCLPKDLRALTHLARSRDLQVPVLEGVLASNTAHKQRALELITALGKKRVGVLGLSFKDGTDDLRESPTVELIEQLIGKGFAVRVFDPDVSLTRLTGSNKAFIDRELPHIASLLSEDVIALIESSDVLVATKASRRYADVLNMARADQTVIDFVRLRQRAFDGQGTYDALVG